MRARAGLAAGMVAALAATAPSARGAEQAVALVVTDASGAFVPDLRREEVQVVENGEVRPIERFDRDERPLDVSLVLDTGAEAAEAYRVHAYEDVAAFVASLPEKAKCTLWTTADRPRRVAELEGPATIEAAVAHGFVVSGASTLLDTLVEAADDLSGTRGRRRALVVASARSAGHTTWEPRQIMEKVRAPRARVLVAYYRAGSGAGGGVAGMLRDASSFTLVSAADHERVLTSLARATGGRFESVETPTAVGAVLRSFAAELAGQYRVLYRSVPAREGRKVEVRLARPGLHWRVTVDAP